MADEPLRKAMFCHDCLKWGTPFTDPADTECGNCGSTATTRYVEERGLLDAAAREAALAGECAPMFRESMRHSSGCYHVPAALFERAAVALASPSRAADGLLLAKAVAEALLRQRGGQVCAAVAAAKAAYREHEEASDGQ